MTIREKIVGFVTALSEFWHRGMWRHERLKGVPPLIGGLVIVFARSLYIVVDAFLRERIRLRAATLTFVSLLSLVPLLAVAFSLFTAFGGLDEVEAHLKNFVIGTLAIQQQKVVTQYLEDFVAGANAGGLGAAGSITLFLTAISTLSNIETAFNDIWGVTEARDWLRRVQIYFPLVTFGPVLFGFALFSIVAAEGHEAVQVVIDRAPYLRAVFGLGPLLAYMILFFSLYAFIPNTKVRVGPALIGGLVASVCWVGAQRLLTNYAGWAISYSAIYGSFGVLPVTILWVYISWTLVLLGATVSFAVQSASSYEPDREIGSREREQVATRLVLAVAQWFADGHAARPAQELINGAQVPPRLGRKLLEELVEGRILVRVLLPREELGYVPAKPLEDLNLGELVNVLRGTSDRVHPPMLVQESGLALLDAGAQAEQNQLCQLSLRDLLEHSKEPTTLAHHN